MSKPRRPRAIILPDDEAPSKPKKLPPQKAEKAEAAAKKSTKTSRRPRAIPEMEKIRPIPDEAAQRATVSMKEIETLADELTPTPPPPSRRRFGWAKIFLAALTGLFSLALGLWADQLIRDLFTRQDWLGWLAIALTALIVLAAIALVTRELLALRRLRHISQLRNEGEQARLRNDADQARSVTSQIVALYENRPDTAKGRVALAKHSDEIIDGRDLIHLTERDLLKPLDVQAQGMVMASAKRVSVVTAVSPRALVDISYVLLENTRLIRRIADHYGGRPGTLGFWRLARNVIAHLAVTGSIAIGDGIAQQLIGSGLAAKLSARLGEGVVNGMLTARIGIAAIDVCRPLAFHEENRPGVRDFMGELLKSNSTEKSPKID